MADETIVRHENNDSIEINKNSKGYTFSVKIYGTFGREGEIDRVISKATETIAKLNLTYQLNAELGVE